ncbi:MFS transporter [Patescibacteria group bacterium]|nr:MFS transporter [Patescibacteria group bacterium]
MDKLLLPFKQNKLLNTLFLSNVFISFHYALVIYINSSFLNTIFTNTQVSALYIIGSILDISLLLNASRILDKLGSYKFSLFVLILEFLTTVGLAVTTIPFLVGLYFIIHLVCISLILFNMDVFVESVSTESVTGSIRATYLTLTNITIVLAPSVIALLVFQNTYNYVYIVSAGLMVPLFNLIKRLNFSRATSSTPIRIKETLVEYLKNKNLYNIFISQFLLQLFYAYMVIYVPLYLIKIIGFSWAEVGVMFTIMLLPFVLFELPVGNLADNKYGEKEFLTIGFIVMGLPTLFISFVTAKIFWIWAVLLFITRIGASFVEISTESYFFKQVNQEKTDVISFFRLARPLSYIVGPLLATLSLQFIPFQYIFIVIGTLMILGCHYSLAITDTK